MTSRKSQSYRDCSHQPYSGYCLALRWERPILDQDCHRHKVSPARLSGGPLTFLIRDTIDHARFIIRD